MINLGRYHNLIQLEKRTAKMDSDVRKENKEFKMIQALYVCMMSLYELADKIFGSIYIAFMRSQSLTISQISSLFSLEQILLAVFDYPTGTIADKHGRKKITSIGFIVWGIGILNFALASNVWLFIPSMVFMALGLALISGAPASWLTDKMISCNVYENRNEIFPKVMTCIKFFSVVASVIAYFLISVDHQLTIIVAGCISIFAGIFGLVTGNDNYGVVKGENILSTLHIHFIEFMKEKKLKLLALRIVVNNISFLIFVLYWQIYATEVIKLEPKYLAFCLMIFMVFFMIGNYSVSKITKIFSNFNSSILGILVSILGFIVLLSYKTTSGFIFAVGLIEFGFGVELVATSTWMCDYVKSETRATYSSIFSTVQAVGGFLFINIIGTIVDAMGLNFAWVIAIVSMCLDILILILFSSKYKSETVI